MIVYPEWMKPPLIDSPLRTIYMCNLCNNSGLSTSTASLTSLYGCGMLKLCRILPAFSAVGRFLKVAHESDISTEMCVSTKNKETSSALQWFFDGRDNILDMVAKWLGWTHNALCPAGEWPRAVDGEDSCPSWMLLIGGGRLLSLQAMILMIYTHQQPDR